MTTTSSHSSTNQPIEKMNETKISKCDVIPWEQKAIGAGDVGLLLGLSSATGLQKATCRPDFPEKIHIRPATWIAKETIERRDRNRVTVP